MEHPDQEQIEYEEQIRERLKAWFQMNRSRLTVGFVFSLIGYIVLYVLLILIKGIAFTNEYIWEVVVTLVVVEGIGFIGYVFWLSFRQIPAEIDKEKSTKLRQLEKQKKDSIPTLYDSLNLKKLELASTGLINYPESKYHNVTLDEYIFTIVNETGQDLKRCFVT